MVQIFQGAFSAHNLSETVQNIYFQTNFLAKLFVKSKTDLGTKIIYRTKIENTTPENGI